MQQGRSQGGLIVDDEEAFRRSTRRWLAGLGYTVVTARSGQEAVRAMRTGGGRINLVILDLVMKGMSGAATFRKIREIVPDVPIIICTGYALDEACRRLLREGANGLIQKPFENRVLALKIRQALGNR